MIELPEGIPYERIDDYEQMMRESEQVVFDNPFIEKYFKERMEGEVAMLTNDADVYGIGEGDATYVVMNRDHLYEIYTQLRALAPDKPVYYIHNHPLPSIPQPSLLDLNAFSELSRYMIPVIYGTKRDGTTGFFKYLEKNSEEARRAVGIKGWKEGRAEFIMEGEAGEGWTWEQIAGKND